ncbi:type VII secretion EssA family protein [Listeria aquatica]|uniref:Uncharacterized protein n=1 Tax=Listeria aquatica FSL S10-1188 TaxID=1265818 RepID=W7AUM8_9LIST|nr:hypothetical protein MAQA_14424 [Listeria aquatica FSL S10-1188]
MKSDTAKTTQEELFKKTNTTQASEVGEDVQDKKGKSTESKSLIAIIGAVVIALGGGIYFASKNTME